MTGWLWILVTVIGVAALGLAIAYAQRRNKAAEPETLAKAEEGARELRERM